MRNGLSSHSSGSIQVHHLNDIHRWAMSAFIGEDAFLGTMGTMGNLEREGQVPWCRYIHKRQHTGGMPVYNAKFMYLHVRVCFYASAPGAPSDNDA